MSDVKLSSELALEGFMHSLPTWKAEMDRQPLPDHVHFERRYQMDTDGLLSALRSGDRGRLEAAFLGVRI